MAAKHILPIKILFSILLFLVTLNTCYAENRGYNKEYEHDRVTKLPGQPTSPNISHFSGYVTVNEAHGRALFYWFFEAQTESIKKPLLLWLNGGPGCSSVGYGAAVELGPLRVDKKGAALEFNQYSWNKEANLLFLESPVGVGFSYTNTTSDFTDINDAFVAEDAYNFLVKWLERFPQFKTRDFFISGESYAGHYVPQLAELVFDRNKDRKKYQFINLKGFIVGNPVTDDYLDDKGILEYAFSHSVISHKDYDTANQACFANHRRHYGSNKCIDAMNVVWDIYTEIDIYNIIAPSCLDDNNNNSSSFASKNDDFSKTKAQKYFRRPKLFPKPGGDDPCNSNYAEAYFKKIEVQRALHINSTVKWKICSDSLFQNYNYNVSSILPIYKKLVEGGLKIWMYSGDLDGRVPFISSRYCVEALNLTPKTPLTSWFYNHQVAGKFMEYAGLTFLTVRGAGHMVPLNKPAEALSLIHHYLSGQPLPTKR